MEIIRYFLLAILLMNTSKSETKYNMKCKARTGCTLTQCDAAHPTWFQKEFGLAEYLDRKEFPITCEMTKDNTIDHAALINAIQNDVKKLEKELSYEKLRNDFLNLRLENMQKEIEVKASAATQHHLQEIRAKMDVMEEQLSKLQVVAPTASSTTVSTKKPITVPGGCDIVVGNICIWTEVRPTTWDVTFPTANEICKQRNSVLGDVPDARTLNAITRVVRSKIPAKKEYVRVWTGMGYNVYTGELYLQNSSWTAFSQWYPGEPTFRTNQVNIAIYVHRDPENKQGMMNAPPMIGYRGAVCQRPLKND